MAFGHAHRLPAAPKCPAAILIMGGLFVLLALIVYGRRKRLILNQTVRMFSRMMSDLGDKYSDDE